MILDNMTYSEICTHLTSDIRHAEGYARNLKFMTYRSEAIKRKKYPLFFKPIFHVTTQRNRWFVVPHVRSRKDLTRIPYYLGCIFKQHDRTIMFMQINLTECRNVNFIFTYAFFERYAIRNRIHGISEEEIVFHFVRSLHKISLQEVEHRCCKKQFLFSENGMALGYADSKNKDLIVFKTYVSVENGPTDLVKMHKDWKFFQSIM